MTCSEYRTNYALPAIMLVFVLLAIMDVLALAHSPWQAYPFAFNVVYLPPTFSDLPLVPGFWRDLFGVSGMDFVWVMFGFNALLALIAGFLPLPFLRWRERRRSTRLTSTLSV